MVVQPRFKPLGAAFSNFGEHSAHPLSSSQCWQAPELSGKWGVWEGVSHS